MCLYVGLEMYGAWRQSCDLQWSGVRVWRGTVERGAFPPSLLEVCGPVLCLVQLLWDARGALDGTYDAVYEHLLALPPTKVDVEVR